MDIITDEAQQGSVLRDWNGATAKVWVYHVSLSRLAIMLENGGNRALYVLAVGCQHFSGPFKWERCEIAIVSDPLDATGKILCRVLDRNVGLELICDSVVLAEGPIGLLLDRNPFDGWLGEY